MSSFPPGTLVFSSSMYSHVVSDQVRSLVCDNCLVRPDILDHQGPPHTLSRCSRCKLSYYCGPDCQREAWTEHREECKYLRRVAPRVPPNIVRLIIRTLRRSNREGDFSEKFSGGEDRRLSDLLMHKDKITNSEHRKEAFASFLAVIHNCVGVGKYSGNELFETYCRILINSAEITDMMGNSIGTGLSIALSSVDHSCDPNCSVVFRGKIVELRTMIPLSGDLGDICRIDYLHRVLPRTERQQSLSESYYFSCKCDLCSGDDGVRGGADVCQGCRGAVGTGEDMCTGCGIVMVDTGGEEKTMFLFNDVSEDKMVPVYNSLRETFHILDCRMIEFAEKTMAVCLNIENYKKYLEVGEYLLTAYRIYNCPLSPSLGLHLAKLAKTAIYLYQSDLADQYLKEALHIFRHSHGTDSQICHYVLSLKETY